MKIIGKDGLEYLDVKSCEEADARFDAKLRAEEEAKQLAKENREKDAKAIEKEYNDLMKMCSENRKNEREAYKRFIDLRNEFNKKYSGGYHQTYSGIVDTKEISSLIEEVIDQIFDVFLD